MQRFSSHYSLVPSVLRPPRLPHVCRFILHVWLVLCCGVHLDEQKAYAQSPFMLGADLSFLPQLEGAGAEFKDGGEVSDLLDIVTSHGLNYSSSPSLAYA